MPSTFSLSLLGKSKQQHQTKAGKEKKYDCENDKSYSKKTLKSAYDLPYAALFKDTRGQKKFEASDVTIVNDAVYSVCDSSWAISKFTRDLVPFSTRMYRLVIQKGKKRIVVMKLYLNMKVYSMLLGRVYTIIIMTMVLMMTIV